MEEQDITNFSNSSSSHRLPTISASEALRNLSNQARAIPTCLPSLDSALLPDGPAFPSKGLPCGSVTEVYGPPGVGKTAFAMQVAVNALHSLGSENGVTWIDTSVPLPGPRFDRISLGYRSYTSHDLTSSPPVRTVDIPTNGSYNNVDYFIAPTLAHLLTLFMHPTTKFPLPRTSLIIVDNISAPFATAFPRSVDDKTNSTFADAARKTNQQKAANRKWAVAGDLSSAMAKIAKLHNVAILVINQVATSLKGVRRATLKPSLSGHGWDAGISNRIVLLRDFAPRESGADFTPEEARSLRFAEVVKLAGKFRTGLAENVIAFTIEDDGIKETKLMDSPPSLPMISAGEEEKRQKRKADEIANSDDEEIGFDSDDDLGFSDEALLTGIDEDPELPTSFK